MKDAARARQSRWQAAPCGKAGDPAMHKMVLSPTIRHLAAGSEAETPVVRWPVLLSTDCGGEVDDQWALALLALSPAVELRGVMGAHGPTLSAAAAAEHAREVLRQMNVTTPPPVVAGAEVPMADATTPV